MPDQPTQPITPFDDYIDRLMRGDSEDPETFIEQHPGLTDEQRDQVRRISGVFGSGKHKVAVEKDDERRLGPYRLLRQLGEGGMGVVWLAEEESLGREVALKLLRSELDRSGEAMERLRREAKAAASIQHPAIVTVHGASESDGVRWLAMEYVPGEGLDEIIDAAVEKGEPLSLPQVMTWCRDIARGLAAAHAAGVVHRDIKPSNIRVMADGRVKLVDFGLAREEGHLTMTQTGTFRGTPYYASPEQVAARRIGIDARTDVYSLGVTLYQVATNEVPFAGDTRQQVFHQILMKEPQQPRRKNPEISRDLETVILTAMEKDPDRRYQTMAEFADDLDALLELRPVRARPVGRALRAWRWMRRNPYRGVAVALAILLLAGTPTTIIILQRSANRAISAQLDEIQLRTDARVARDLLVAPRTLWPADASRLADLDAWLDEVDGLESRRDSHAATLESLRGQEQDDTIRWRIGVIEGMFADLDKLRQIRSLVQARRDFAAGLETLTTTGPEAVRDWNKARKAIAAHSDYGGLRIAPQKGLLPLGPDPTTGLWEFWHPLTGERPVRSESTGEYEMTGMTGMVFVLLPGGTVDIGAERPSAERPKGSPNVDPSCFAHEGPVHSVTLDPFFISKYEFTYGQQWACFGGRGSKTHKHFDAATLPVGAVMPTRADTLVANLSLQLPTEVQWEYAARAGSTTIWATGDTVASLQGKANIADAHRQGRMGGADSRYNKELDDGFVGEGPIGSLLPNGFGLHDILGNVTELCRDRFGAYDKVDARPGDGLREGKETERNTRVARGGYYADRASRARSAARLRVRPNTQQQVLGLRFVRPIE